MVAKVKSQISMDDNIVKDDELEKILEERQELKQSASDYKKADKKAKDRIRSIETPTPYRVGRFIISSSIVPAKTVAFDTAEGIRFSIKTADEQE